MNEILLAIFIIIVTAIVTNFTSIYINWYLIRGDIEDIRDKGLKKDLLQSFLPLYKVFFKRVLYHADSDYFANETDYKTFRTYMNIHSIKYQIHSYHRYESGLFDDRKEEVSSIRELETSPIES